MQAGKQNRLSLQRGCSAIPSFIQSVYVYVLGAFVRELVHAFTFACVCVCVCVCVHARACACVLVGVGACMWVWARACLHVCVHQCMCALRIARKCAWMFKFTKCMYYRAPLLNMSTLLDGCTHFCLRRLMHLIPRALCCFPPSLT